jgi:hypothetical protein
MHLIGPQIEIFQDLAGRAALVNERVEQGGELG